jgi:urate oxidase
MGLVRNTYGKGRVRVMRVHKDGARHEVRELSVQVMLEGDFAPAYVAADNSGCVSTDTMKNLVNVVAHEQLALENEPFVRAVAARFLAAYPQVSRVGVTGHETKWSRLVVDGAEHDHAFTLDGNGTPFARIVATREASELTSGVDGYTFLKTTESGWADFFDDEFTTIKPTRDRLCATSMLASWTWASEPADYPAANAAVLAAMLKVFATTYSASVQDSLYRMGEAALAAVPEIAEISLACPNKHYLLMNLSPFGIDNRNEVFLPTDEPHGQIECTIGRG